MGDLISRRAAIEALGEKPEGNDEWSFGCRSQWEWDTETLKTMPSAQQWIPCTPETMPEREGRYVCTYTYDGKKDVFMFRYEDGQFMVPWYVETVTAWYKPLDPWEGGQNNGKN